MIKIDFLDTSTRLGRIRHLGLFLFWLVIPASCLILGTKVIPENIPDNFFMDFVKSIFFILGFGLLLSSALNLFCIKVRRLHDFNHSAWWLLLCFIPVIGELWLLAIFCIPGTKGDNKFGTQPEKPIKKDYLLVLALIVLPVMEYSFFSTDLIEDIGATERAIRK